MALFEVQIPVNSGTYIYYVTARSKKEAVEKAMDGDYDSTEHDLELDWDEAEVIKEG